MNPLSIHTLYFALIAVYFGISDTAAEPQPRYLCVLPPNARHDS